MYCIKKSGRLPCIRIIFFDGHKKHTWSFTNDLEFRLGTKSKKGDQCSFASLGSSVRLR